MKAHRRSYIFNFIFSLIFFSSGLVFAQATNPPPTAAPSSGAPLPTLENTPPPTGMSLGGITANLGPAAQGFVEANRNQTNFTSNLDQMDESQANRAKTDPCGYFYREQGWDLTKLDYMGVPFSKNEANQTITPTRCVEAKTDAEAADKCGGRFVNPANPQYFSSQGQARLREIANGLFADIPLARDSNPFGFYFCLASHGANAPTGKGRICQNRRVLESRSTWPAEYVQNLDVQWAGRGRDGDCNCRSDSDDYQLCVRPDTDEGAAAIQNQVKTDTCEARGFRRDPGPSSRSNQKMCQCPNDDRVFAQGNMAQCNTPVQALVPPTEPTDRLKSCVDNWKARADRCVQSSNVARTACASSDAQNANSNSAIGVLETASAFHNQLKTGSGAQNQCFLASLASSSGSKVLGRSQVSCDDEYNACIGSCQNQLQEFEQECRQFITSTEATGHEAVQTQLNQQYFDQHRPDIASQFTRGQEVCSGEVARSKTALEQTLDSLGDATTTATRCMCQLSASGGQNCNSIPSVATCNANPNAAGCAIYSSISACTPGAGYNAFECNCQINPSTPGCVGKVDPQTNLSKFAGADVKAAAAASVAGLTTSGIAGQTFRTSNVDLAAGGTPSATDPESLRQGDSLSADGSGGAGVMSVGGGAGGGLAGGSGVGLSDGVPVEGGEVDASKGSMMGQLKTLASRLLNKSKDSGNGSLQNQKALQERMAAQRGIASARKGVGSKNMNIWQMMNQCVQGETCRTNQSNYILSP
ncbi:hypothetical protein [Pseudobdellovibrio exovorus]|uniref:Uncharacterized protein n=1 Tax=Pseudobdellovibrio exovorus JSS TaxID=1184267 RepID=M4V8J6_9BACT|nr:hypothetical protein [Pseudobdellovibrio exovorus]AGH94780.1 hypothetical protein A11Q_560 [Pseudobdellovibrio exovorus JSS]